MTERRSGSSRGSSPKPRPRSGAQRSTSAASGRTTRSSAPREAAQTRSTAPAKRRNAAGPRKPSPARRQNRSTASRVLRAAVIVALLLIVAVGVTGCAVYASISSQLPDPDLTKAKGSDQSTIIYDRNGKVITKVWAEENRQVVTLSEIPEKMQQALIATEDKRFYQHEGVDPLGIARALVTDIMKGEKAQGGSTITQQYVKQAFVTSEKTLKRKLQEAILAQRVERRYSKDQILEHYLNTVYFGHGAYGVEAASRIYFGKGVGKLTYAEAAMLAGVIKSPGRYSPYSDAEAARNRRDTVLGQMLDQGYIDQATHAKATSNPVRVAGLPKGRGKAPYFVEWIKQQLVDEYGEKAVYRGGLRVKTTLDLRSQAAAERAIAETLDREGDPSAAIVALKPGTGEVVAMVGGKDFATQQYNVAVQGKRQPGSSFKPFVLATALSQGVSPEQTFTAGPASLRVGDQVWKVTGAHSGPAVMRLRSSTEQSVNSVFAQLILKVGADKVVQTAEKLGISKGVTPVPAIALGGLAGGVSPLEMAEAYATLAASGTHAEPYGISEVKGSDGGVLLAAKPDTDKAIDPAVAYLTTDILTGVIKRGTGTAAAIGRPAAGKTGTTQEYRDAWFVGYTPELATAVWVGYPDSQREMKAVHGRAVTGGSFPAEIWSQFMTTALKGTPKRTFSQPSGLTKVRVCADSGGLATSYCPKPFSALMLRGKLPKECTLHATPEVVTVPQLVGLTKEDALAKVDELVLTAKVVERQVAGVAAGMVAEQTPPAGTTVKPKAVVTLVVSSGPGTNSPPTASFVMPAEAAAGSLVKLDASGSKDDTAITKYYWEFADGQTGSGVKLSHAWPGPGTYEVTLWVTDDRGEQASVTRTITIR